MGTITYYRGRPITELSREKLIEAVEVLAGMLKVEQARAIFAAQREADRPTHKS